MKIDVTKIETNAAVLLSNTTAYILNEVGNIIAELEATRDQLQVVIKDNEQLREQIKNLSQRTSEE